MLVSTNWNTLSSGVGIFPTINSLYAHPTMTNPYEKTTADRRLQCEDRKSHGSCTGKHGIGKCNYNDGLLVALRSEFELIVTNTMFKQNDEHIATWVPTRSGHGHMVDFIVTRCRDNVDIRSTHATRGVNIWTGHQMMRSNVAFRIRQSTTGKGQVS